MFLTRCYVVLWREVAIVLVALRPGGASSFLLSCSCAYRERACPRAVTERQAVAPAYWSSIVLDERRPYASLALACCKA